MEIDVIVREFIQVPMNYTSEIIPKLLERISAFCCCMKELTNLSAYKVWVVAFLELKSKDLTHYEGILLFLTEKRGKKRKRGKSKNDKAKLPYWCFYFLYMLKNKERNKKGEFCGKKPSKNKLFEFWALAKWFGLSYPLSLPPVSPPFPFVEQG